MDEQNTSAAPFSQPLLRTGLALIGLSSVILAFSLKVSALESDRAIGLFFFSYLLSLLYAGFTLFRKKWPDQDRRAAASMTLVLFLISAYALNCFIPVFERAAIWFTTVQVLAAVIYLLIPFADRLPGILRNAAAFAFGISFTVFCYLAIYLIPVYPVSFPCLIALGISIHAFVPIFFIIFTIRWIIRTVRTQWRLLWFFAAGVLFCLVWIAGYSIRWRMLNNKIGRDYQHTLLGNDSQLPNWIKVAQDMPQTAFAKRFIKAPFVYTMAEQNMDFFMFSMPQGGFDERPQHDPLVVIASYFTRETVIDRNDRLRILECGFDSRHQTQERLWSGDHLRTTNVISNIRIWPQYHMAYTEKTVTVTNSSTWRGSEEEAIYTFHLPEGGVVTSLSLWIDGQESKGVLTTKGKADSAYHEVVGVQRRDPSVVHWQEGNTVSVRVFPVPGSGKREFKIGITSPLLAHHHRLTYSHIYFNGPDAADAQEIVQVDWQGKADEDAMKSFTSNGQNRFIAERSYDPDWSFSFADPGIAADAFSFDGHSYRISPYTPVQVPASFQTAYLDLNCSWTKEEFNTVMDMLQGMKVYASDDDLVAVGADRDALFDRLTRRRFSLFPFYRIAHPESALFISKNPEMSPNMRDLNNSEFAQRLDYWVKSGSRLCFFDLGNQLSPYLKSLKEHRLFNYEHGTTADLARSLRSRTFAASTETANRVVIDDAGIAIERDTLAGMAKGPDHFMRLFAYNHLMQQMKQGLFSNLEGDSMLVQEATQAYIVTPLSSLVVLETQADYDRFNIKKAENSLQNAGMKANGAVPEPHEWALILLAAGTLVVLRFNKRFSLIKQS